MDPSVPSPAEGEGAANEYSDRMLELFRQVFGLGYGVHGGAQGAAARQTGQEAGPVAGRREEEADPTWGGGSPGGRGADGIFSVSPGRGGFAAFGLGTGFGGRAREEEGDREEFSGMYS